MNLNPASANIVRPAAARPTGNRPARNWNRILAGVAIAALAVAWFLGGIRTEAEVAPHIALALPRAQRFTPVGAGIYAGYRDDQSGPVLVGYVGLGQASGYGGPMKVAVGIDPQGRVVGVDVIDDKETPAYLRDVLGSHFAASLRGKAPSDAFQLGSDLDAVSGATFTARGLADSVRQASRKVATEQLGQSFPEDQAAGFPIGVPEITLLVLYGVALYSHRRRFRWVKQARWLTLLAGLIVLGFLFNRPLRLANISAVLLGFWPSWQTNLYWYILLGGIALILALTNQTPYCDSICPFGAAQECLAVVGRAKNRTPRRGQRALIWAQRGLALGAILVALLWRNPDLSSYELFGVLFRFTFNTWEFEALCIVLMASLVIKRPWCNYLCPLRPVMDFLRLLRGWVAELLRKRAHPQHTAVVSREA